jgi:hypothetical protein
MHRRMWFAIAIGLTGLWDCLLANALAGIQPEREIEEFLARVETPRRPGKGRLTRRFSDSEGQIPIAVAVRLLLSASPRAGRTSSPAWIAVGLCPAWPPRARIAAAR